MASGRLAFVFGVHGPVSTIDTACSSALVSLHLASVCRCHPEAFAAAANLILLPVVTVSFARAGMLSADGRCKTFDVRANGYVRSEGVGAVVVSDIAPKAAFAQAHVGGCAVRSDGRSASLTAPNGQAQRTLLVASLIDAGMVAAALSQSEAHGTGTALGDPIEAGSLGAAVLAARGELPLVLGGIKASVGHGESTAGMSGVLTLWRELEATMAVPNAQLRALNPHLRGALRGTSCTLPVQVGGVATCGAGGVSSFGYSGTIAHAVLRCTPRHAEARTLPLVYVRRFFPWREVPHPFAQQRTPSSDGGTVFRSPTSGALLAAVAEHVVHGRVIFPGAGYLEMARAAAAGAALHGVFFLQPLAVEARLAIECTVAEGRFEVRAGEGEGALADVHCSGGVGMHVGARRTADLAPMHASLCSRACAVSALYAGFHAAGLQYGPRYRTLVEAWGGERGAVARLRARLTYDGMQVHPSDLDDALCVGALVAPSGGDETRLPFAVDAALLHGDRSSVLWAVRCLVDSAPVPRAAF